MRRGRAMRRCDHYNYRALWLASMELLLVYIYFIFCCHGNCVTNMQGVFLPIAIAEKRAFTTNIIATHARNPRKAGGLREGGTPHSVTGVRLVCRAGGATEVVS